MQMSSATTSDHCFLKAHLKAIDSKRYACAEHEDRIRLSGDRVEERLEALYQSRGCGRVVPHPVDRIDEFEFHTCLCRLKHPLTGQLIGLHRHYQAGLLPFSGGVMDQPAQVMELLEIVDSVAQDKRIEQAEKERKRGRA